MDLELMSCKELKDVLNQMKLPLNGKKSEMIKRIRATYEEAVNSSSEDEESDKGERDDDKEDSDSNTHKEASSDDEFDDALERQDEKNVYRNNNFLNLRDVEEILLKFSGDDNLSFDKWLEKFEEQAVLLKWSKVQKYIYAKKLIVGTAAMFLGSEKGVTSWTKLKKCLF